MSTKNDCVLYILCRNDWIHLRCSLINISLPWEEVSFLDCWCFSDIGNSIIGVLIFVMPIGTYLKYINNICFLYIVYICRVLMVAVALKILKFPIF